MSHTIEISNLATDLLKPNDYNPNQMDKEEFEELVSEVRRLGRLPKPVVVRPGENGSYLIVDGEHGWRAAKAVGLDQVPCEVVEADDFESMRQTYKRNQHGTHDRVLLGRMFERMMANRDLSRRALAEEAGVSEGTVRNVLAYAEASQVRNSYASEGARETINGLSVRQVQTYLKLPRPFGDLWIDHRDANERELYRTLTIKLKGTGWEEEGFKTMSFFDDYGGFQGLADIARPPFLDIAMLCTKGNIGFAAAMNKALRFRIWFDRNKECIEGLDAYLPAVATAMGNGWADIDPVAFVDSLLPCGFSADRETIVLAVTAEDWNRIISDFSEKAKYYGDFCEMVKAAIALLHEEEEEGHSFDPRTANRKRELAKAPEYIRQAEIPTEDKFWLMALLKEGVEGMSHADIEESVKTAISSWESNRKILKSTELPDDVSAYVSARSVRHLVIDGVQSAKQDAERKARLEENARILQSRESMVTEIMQHYNGHTIFNQWRFNGRPGIKVFAERLTALPLPELAFLTCSVLDDLSGEGHLRWRDFLEDEPGYEFSDSPTRIE